MAICSPSSLDGISMSSLSLKPWSLSLGYTDAHAAAQLLHLVSGANYTAAAQAAAMPSSLADPPPQHYWPRLAQHLPRHRDWPLFVAHRPSGLLPEANASSRCAVYMPLLSIPALANTAENTFFRKVTDAGLPLNLEAAAGTLTLLLNTITCGTLSTLSVAETPTEALSHASRMLTFLMKQSGSGRDVSEIAEVRAAAAAIAAMIDREEHAQTRR
jgi:hypothetical protein